VWSVSPDIISSFGPDAGSLAKTLSPQMISYLSIPLSILISLPVNPLFSHSTSTHSPSGGLKSTYPQYCPPI